MADYTPTTEHIKYAYVQFTRNAFVASTGELEQEFDRWFQQHDEEVQAAVWAEAIEHMKAHPYRRDTPDAG